MAKYSSSSENTAAFLFPLVRGEIFGTGVDEKSSARSVEMFASSPRKWQEAVSSRGVSLSVCHGRHPDVIGMRQFWCDFCVNAQTWRGNFVKLRHFTKFCVQKNISNEREVFDATMSSEKGLEADPLRREKSAQEMRARELAAARRQLLCADRQNRANETSEQGEERLRAEERKRAAFKRVNETSEQREERLAAQRNRAAFGRSSETSQ